MLMLRRIYSPFVGVAILANAIGTAVIFVLVAVMNVDVVARGVFHAPLRGVVEVVIFSLILIVFMQLPDVVRSNRLTRSDGFLLLARDRFPGFAGWLGRFIDAAAAVFMGLIAWTVWPEFSESFETCHFFSQPEFGPPPSGELFKDLSDAFARCEYFGTPGIFTAPWWPARLAIAFSVTLCALIFAFKAVLGDAASTAQNLKERPE
ncbi:MAG: TRAP transporter small permease subunit [Pseudomonadota bacterium]